MLYRAALITLGLLLWAAPASAIIQPSEVNDDARCGAAINATDEPSVLVYCKAAAEDHGTDAAQESGPLKAHDLMLEAGDLVIVGYAERIEGRNTGSEDNSAMLFSTAHDLLIEARAYADAKQLSIIHNMLTIAPFK